MRWWDAFEKATRELGQDPFRYGLAAESGIFDYELRQFLFKTRRGRTYHGVFVVAGDEVRVAHKLTRRVVVPGTVASCCRRIVNAISNTMPAVELTGSAPNVALCAGQAPSILKCMDKVGSG